MKKYSTIPEYIDSFPLETQKKLQELRTLIQSLSANSIETIQYNIPTIWMNSKYLIYFSGNKKHIGMYPIPKGNAAFQKKLDPYKSGKSTIRFPLDKPLPKTLILEIVKYAIQDNHKRVENKKSGKTT